MHGAGVVWSVVWYGEAVRVILLVRKVLMRPQNKKFPDWVLCQMGRGSRKWPIFTKLLRIDACMYVLLRVDMENMKIKG